MTPQQRLADVFVALAGGSGEGSLDVSRTLAVLAEHSPSLLGVRAASVVYVPGGRDETRVSGSEPGVTCLEREAVGWREGPGHVPYGDAALTVGPVPLDRGPAVRAWPRYASRALSLGHTHLVALPLRVSDGALGVFVLFAEHGDAFSPGSLSLAQSLADFTAITLHRAREAELSLVLVDQLERALSSRVVIEQAKGVLAVRRGLSVDDAFEALRAHARSRRRVLSEVAREVVEGRADPALVGPEVVKPAVGGGLSGRGLPGGGAEGAGHGPVGS